jgi:hypothetical protein
VQGGRIEIAARRDGDGWGQDEDRRCVREAGFDHHLVKPVDLASPQSLPTSLARTRTGKAGPA